MPQERVFGVIEGLFTQEFCPADEWVNYIVVVLAIVIPMGWCVHRPLHAPSA